MLSNEKEELELPVSSSRPQKAQQDSTFSSRWILLLASLAAAWQLASYFSARPAAALPSGLYWTPCPDLTTTLCAYLTVPMDYHNPMPNDTVSLALRKLPATAPVKERLGTLFINPGGPGGSGHNFVVRVGEQLSVITKGRMDILSWDPRSVNLTSPSLDCFETPGDAKRFMLDVEKSGLPYDSRSDASFAANDTTSGELAWAHKMGAFHQAMSGACSERADARLLRASSTAFVVRDMVSILDALGEDKLTYWGFSYGTILGSTFSAMFPEKVHRVILDGVSDAELYTNNMLEWGRSGMDDTHKTYEGFLSSCAESGPKGCALAKGDDTAASIGDRLAALQDKLRAQPLPVFSSKVGPGIVGPADIQYTMFHALYAPKTWPATAAMLASLENGNGTLIYESTNAANANLARKDAAKNPYHRSMDSPPTSTAAIMCSDTDRSVFSDLSADSYLSYTHELEKMSPTGAIWSIWVGTCRFWKGKALEAYRGPWSVDKGLKQTNFPLLYMSMTADPVTPLSAAKKMAAAFGNSSATLLVQTGFGHCTSAHPSLCTAKAVRSYLLDGVVPEYGTECHADPGFLFPHSTSELTDFSALSAEDARLTRALHSLASEIRYAGMKPGGAV